MGEVTLFDAEPEFAVARDEAGAVALTIRAEHNTIRVSVGRVYDSASLLARSLHHLAEDLDNEILDEWEDIPDEFDAYITVDRGRYHVSTTTKLKCSTTHPAPTRPPPTPDLPRSPNADQPKHPNPRNDPTRCSMKPTPSPADCAEGSSPRRCRRRRARRRRRW
jgi:hypothetical protein